MWIEPALSKVHQKQVGDDTPTQIHIISRPHLEPHHNALHVLMRPITLISCSSRITHLVLERVRVSNLSLFPLPHRAVLKRRQDHVVSEVNFGGLVLTLR